MTRQTSVEAYSAIKENGLLGKLQFMVYEILYHHGPMTRNDLIRYVNRVQDGGGIGTRLSELRAKGVVIEAGERIDPKSNMSNILWDVTNRLPVKLEKPKKIKCAYCNGKGYHLEQQIKLF